jgi:hypothetical protein
MGNTSEDACKSKKSRRRAREKEPEADKYPEYVFKLIVLGSNAYDDRLSEGASYEANSFAEMMTPINAFMMTREVRGDLAVNRARDLFGERSSENVEPQGRFYQVNLNHRYFKYPLGWQLSSVTRKLIAANVSRAGACNLKGRLDEGWLEGPNGQRGRTVGFVEFFQDNACAQCEIIKNISVGLEKGKANPSSSKGNDMCG